MNKSWIIIKHEYRKHVLRKGFLLALFSVPIWILVSIVFALIAVILTHNGTPIGFVDHSGVLTNAVYPPKETSFLNDPDIYPYSSEDSARKALDAGKIQAYYVIPRGYPTDRTVKSYFLKQPKDPVNNHFETFMRMNMIKDLTPDQSTRLLNGTSIVTIALNGQNKDKTTADLFKIAAPILGAILLITAIFTSSGYLMQAIVDEKENKTMEILATSLSPGQIMSSKVIALISVGLTQVVVWALFGSLGIIVGQSTLPFMRAIQVDWGIIATILLMVLPTFIMVSALMTAIGATVTEASEGQQVSGLITLPVMLPFMLMGVILPNPNGPIALILSFFPLTAPMTILLRSAFSTVPTWQIIAVGVMLILFAGLSLWFAGRLFRAGMLRYGKRMSWKEVVRVFRHTS
jgi:ABC-2 type transport system permease protein